MALGNAGSVFTCATVDVLGREPTGRPAGRASVTLQSLFNPSPASTESLAARATQPTNRASRATFSTAPVSECSDADDERKGEGRQEEDQQHSRRAPR